MYGMVHDAYPELRQGFIIGAYGSFGARVLPYPKGKKLRCLFESMPVQNEPGEPKMTTMSEILRRQSRLMECFDEFSVVHLSG